MTPQLALIARKMERKSSQKAPAPAASGLGEAFDALLQQRIDEALAVERERHFAETAQQKQPLPPPPAPVKKPAWVTSKVTHRDHVGRIWITETVAEGRDTKLITQVSRDEFGNITGSKTFPMLVGETYKPGKDQPGPREYRPGVPRKLYGNDEE